jgi:hypothetical protein
MVDQPEWVTFTQVDGRTAAGRRVPIKTGVVEFDGQMHFAVAIDNAPPLLLDEENGKRLGVNVFVELHEKVKRARQ